MKKPKATKPAQRRPEAAVRPPVTAERALLVVAHPDDESLFFAGLVLRNPRWRWTLVCLTDGNADGDGARRRRQFLEACRRLGVRDAQWWGYADRYEQRLPVAEIAAKLRQLGEFRRIFTHGILGEYGHPHHQDAACAVHRAFPRHRELYSAGYNAAPDLTIALTKKEFARKCELLSAVYGSETTRFLNLLPATSSESFVRVSAGEVEKLYTYFAGTGALDVGALKTYRWMAEFIAAHRNFPRPF